MMINLFCKLSIFYLSLSHARLLSEVLLSVESSRRNIFLVAVHAYNIVM